MFYYLTLLLGSLAVLLAIYFIYSTIYLVFNSVSKSTRPVSESYKPVTTKRSSERRQCKSRIISTVHDSLAPMERKNRETAWDRAKTHPVDPDPQHKQDFDWLLQERKSVLVDGSYKVRRRYSPPVPTLEMVSQPFRHKRAQWVLEHEASKKT